MKFNFRKIASVISSAVMVTSTVALAAAANFPAPFVKSGAADVAVVYGSSAAVASTDLLAVADIQRALSEELAKETAVGASGAAVTTTSGEQILLSGPDKLIIGRNVTQSRTTTIGSTDLPSLLKTTTYQGKDGSSYTYEQKLTLGSSLQYTHFTDTDYKNRQPTLGIKVPRNTELLNYTITFTPTLKSKVSTAGRLQDIENTDLILLGKNYKLLNAYNATNIKLELMGGAVSDTLALDESKEYTIGDKKYTVKVGYVGQGSGTTNEAKLEVNGETTNKMNIGGTQKLSDGTQLGIRDILYQNFAGGVMKVEFSLGAEKLTIEDNTNLKVNDNTANNLYGSIVEGTSSDQRTIDSINIQWKPDTNNFITANSSLVMPALSSLQLLMADPTMPAQEVTKLGFSAYTAQLSVPFKTGSYTMDLISGNGTMFNNVGGKSGENKNLKTGNGGTTILYDIDTDNDFVATYLSGTTGESYLLNLGSMTKENGINYTTVRDSATGATAGTCDKKKIGGPGQTGDSCTVGQITLTFSNGQYDSNNVTIAVGTNTYFDRIVTKEGLLIYLPIDNSSLSASGAVPGGAYNFSNISVAPLTYKLRMVEEDKNFNIGSGQEFNFTLGWTSDGKPQVSSTPVGNFSGSTSMLFVPDTSSKYVDYIMSDLGTKVTYDTSPNQDVAEVEYHGGQTYANLFLTVPGATAVSSGATGGSVKSLGSVMYKDSEASSFASNNIIVVGGSCINTVAATLLGSATPLCGSDFTAKTGVDAGQFLIQTFSRTGDKVATLVAGFNAADTQNAAKYLVTQTVDTSAGKEYKGTSATSAEVVTTTA